MGNIYYPTLVTGRYQGSLILIYLFTHQRAICPFLEFSKALLNESSVAIL